MFLVEPMFFGYSSLHQFEKRAIDGVLVNESSIFLSLRTCQLIVHLISLSGNGVFL
jgi:hypothetical protein